MRVYEPSRVSPTNPGWAIGRKENQAPKTCSSCNAEAPANDMSPCAPPASAQSCCPTAPLGCTIRQPSSGRSWAARPAQPMSAARRSATGSVLSWIERASGPRTHGGHRKGPNATRVRPCPTRTRVFEPGPRGTSCAGRSPAIQLWREACSMNALDRWCKSPTLGGWKRARRDTSPGLTSFRTRVFVPGLHGREDASSSRGGARRSAGWDSREPPGSMNALDRWCKSPTLHGQCRQFGMVI
jgi:hypothetical protein